MTIEKSKHMGVKRKGNPDFTKKRKEETNRSYYYRVSSPAHDNAVSHNHNDMITESEFSIYTSPEYVDLINTAIDLKESQDKDYTELDRKLSDFITDNGFESLLDERLIEDSHSVITDRITHVCTYKDENNEELMNILQSEIDNYLEGTNTSYLIDGHDMIPTWNTEWDGKDYFIPSIKIKDMVDMTPFDYEDDIENYENAQKLASVMQLCSHDIEPFSDDDTLNTRLFAHLAHNKEPDNDPDSIVDSYYIVARDFETSDDKTHTGYYLYSVNKRNVGVSREKINDEESIRHEELEHIYSHKESFDNTIDMINRIGSSGYYDNPEDAFGYFEHGFIDDLSRIYDDGIEVYSHYVDGYDPINTYRHHSAFAEKRRQSGGFIASYDQDVENAIEELRDVAQDEWTRQSSQYRPDPDRVFSSHDWEQFETPKAVEPVVGDKKKKSKARKSVDNTLRAYDDIDRVLSVGENYRKITEFFTNGGAARLAERADDVFTFFGNLSGF